METRSPSAVRSHAIAAILFCILAGGFPSVAQVPRRSEEPVVLTGSALPQLSGAVPSRIVAFRSASPWTQVPVQIDERALVTFATIYNSTQPAGSLLTYTDPAMWTGADPDASFDADDELVLRASDAGPRSSGGADPAGTLAGSLTEITVTDPISGDRGYLYLFRSDGSLDPSAGVPPIPYAFKLMGGEYKLAYHTDNGPNPEDSRVATGTYDVHFADRWIRDEIEIRAGGATAADILDRHKSLFGPGDCQRTEDTFSNGEGAFIVNRTGPIRALRGYVGANSGPTTFRIHAFYPKREVLLTGLRVHAIPGILDYFDYSPAASGMIFRDDLNPAGVTIDGVPDSVATGAFAWEIVTGAQGTLAQAIVATTDIPNFTSTSYYSDATTPTVPQCTGDASEYGASGFWRDAPIPNSDQQFSPYYIFEVSRFLRYGPPDQPAVFASDLAAQVANPLIVTVGGGTSACPDSDNDGYAACSSSCSLPAGRTCGDCDDADASVHPDASDATCNGVDENCSGTADEGYLPVPTSCGVGACAATGATSCVGGAVRDSCTPGSPIPEICDNGIDDDCDAATDLADPDCGLPNCPDTDGDGYAACDATCSVPPGKACGDCNDGSADIHPGGAELCNGLNDDCSGGADDRQCAAFDADGDGLVDGVELSRVGRAFGLSSANPSLEWWASVDFNHDGRIDGTDLAVIASVFGLSCSGGMIPCAP